jgi:hypothetical protein
LEQEEESIDKFELDCIRAMLRFATKISCSKLEALIMAGKKHGAYSRAERFDSWRVQRGAFTSAS